MGHARLFLIGVVGLTGMMLSLGQIAFTQEKKPAPKKPAPIAPAEKLEEGWDAIDERLIFLMIRLANTETSLDAVENAIAKATGKKSVKTADAKRADLKNEEMDRRGGGPLRWSSFYGTTAEKFFYHPTDRNSTYHTVTVLSQQGPRADNKVGGGVPAGQGLPVHQRPPQFDYIYRANEKAKDRAESEAAQFKGKIEALLERRQRLEAEQAGLWCEIAFRAVAHYDLHKKPIYRFEPLLVKQDDPTSKQHAEIMKSAAVFMRLALSIIDAAQKNQATTFSAIKTSVSEAREKLDDTLLRQGVDVTDKKIPEAKFAALAKRLEDVASNLSESYEVAAEGDKEKDQQRKDTFRGLLQESLVSYAQIILALDEMSLVMKDEWKIKPDLDKPLAVVSLASVEAVRPLVPIPSNELPLEQRPLQLAQVSELGGGPNGPPWISDDGLTIYWHDVETIWTARRASPNSLFTGKHEVFKGRHPTVSRDGLEMVLLAPRTDGQKGTSLHMAVRQSPDQFFGRPTEIRELRTQSSIPKSPCLSHDGLTLYFNMPSGTGTGSDLIMSRRAKRNSPWSKSVPVPGMNKKNLTWAFVSSDELFLLCSDESGERVGQNGNLMLWQRADRSKPFVDKGYIEPAALPPLYGRGPRYVAATGELFFARREPPAEADKWTGIWVLKGYDLRALAR